MSTLPAGALQTVDVNDVRTWDLERTVVAEGVEVWTSFNLAPFRRTPRHHFQTLVLEHALLPDDVETYATEAEAREGHARHHAAVRQRLGKETR